MGFPSKELPRRDLASQNTEAAKVLQMAKSREPALSFG
jgi:hypothetical protein